ncbi:MAG TPA: acyltransferase [Jatrophihabitans sp.]|jgi:peptidoglycan/LPS O-acetylase OafA/YrhL|uniref:acyltransferase family protein n=1 Tax=Jatrophihabitans sp. TaxID=1932789 RepID=UPI002F0EF55F
MSAPRTAGAEVSRHFDALDGMRAIACYAVILTHVGFQSGRSFGTGPQAPWLSRLDTAVPIFLMLSGFLLYRPFVAQAYRRLPVPRAGGFYWRRAVRVLPAFWVTAVVTLGLLSTRRASLADWLSYLSLTEIYNGHDVDPSLTHIWTLVAEVSLYAVVPLLALSLRGRRSSEEILLSQCLLVGGLLAASVAWQITVFEVDSLGYVATKWLPGTIDWFALGMLLAALSAAPAGCTALLRTRQVLSQWAGAPELCWLLAILLYWFLTLPLAGPIDLAMPAAGEHLAKNLLQAAVVFFLMLPLTLGDGGVIGRVLGNRVSRFLGQISYGVYLWHLPALLFLQRALDIPIWQGHFWKLLVLTTVSSSVLGALSWYLLERPLLRRFSRPTWRNLGTPSTARQTPATQSA